MFPVKAEHIRRVSFATRLFPKLVSAISLDTSKFKTADEKVQHHIYDGELFCGGKSKNKDMLSFFGFISESDTSASFVQLPGFRRSLKKLTNLVEYELDSIGANEVLLPTIIPQKLWDQSGRLARQQDALAHVYNFTDKAGTKLLLGPTFEESVTRMVAAVDNITELDLPLLVYQTSPKFRYEPNPRFGLIRSNEFLMNDAYSFDASLDQAIGTYTMMSDAYQRIFKKLGLNCVKIESGTGDIGGKFSHEYQLPLVCGEDTIVECDNCQKAYNLEMYLERKTGQKDTCIDCGSANVKHTKALELGHTFLLSDIYSKPLKAKFSSFNGTGQNFEMGCYGLGLTRILAAGVDYFSLIPSHAKSDGLLQLRWPNNVEPYTLGIVGPAKRSKQHQAGSSEFLQRLVQRILDSTKDVDFLVEDREKEGIAKRLFRLKSIGVPYIITIGQKFLQDEPEVELLRLDDKKETYEQFWFKENEICDYFSQVFNPKT